jgi:hypothetical protein
VFYYVQISVDDERAKFILDGVVNSGQVLIRHKNFVASRMMITKDKLVIFVRI